jgi:hypothetical protein
MTTLA